jgi:hypothetical protein
MKKQNIGMLVILGGVAIIGFFWFKRNKPQLAKSQLADLTAQSNSLSAGADTIDKPFVYSQNATSGVNPYTSSTLSSGGMYSNLTPAEVTALTVAVQQACPSCSNLDIGTSISNQISQGLQNVDFSQLSSLGLANLDFSNIKIK